MHEEHPRQIGVGMRNIKTALAATLCAFLYLLIDRNPTFACIGAIFGMGYDLGNSWLNGGNRLFGTIIGGFIAMALFSLYIRFVPDGSMQLLILPFLFVGVVVLIVACQVCRWPGGIQPGGVILCILLFSQPVDSYIPYSLNRMFDTGVGVMIAMGVNLLLPRERVLRWMEFFHGKKRKNPAA